MTGARLTLVGITDQVFLPRRSTRHEAPLQSGWEACTASTAQPGRFYFFNDFVRRHLAGQNLAPSLIAPRFFIGLQGP